MTEFYIDLTNDEINNVITKKMEIYEDLSISILKFHYIEIKDTNIIYKGALNFSKLANFKLYKYVGIHLGTDIYHFYNIITQ